MQPVRGKPLFHQYEKLLYKIAGNFGFGDFESAELVRQVICDTDDQYVSPGNRGILRISLSKAMVHKCIFRISSEMFSQNIFVQKKPAILGYYSNHKNTSSLKYPEIPLSLRAVYILNNSIGFTEVEIADILNTTSLNVKHRFSEAKSLLKNLSNDALDSKSIF